MVSMVKKPTESQSTRERILEAARVEFSERGFDGARVDRIARLAGVNKAMIYYHFQSKSDLYETVIDGFVSKLGGFVERALDEAHDLPELLAALANYYVTFFESSGDFAPIVLREVAGGGDRMGVILGRALAGVGVVDRIRKMFRKEKRAGRLRDVDVAHTFVSFLGMNLVYLFFSPIVNSVWEIKNEDKFRRSRPKAVVDLFLNGARRP